MQLKEFISVFSNSDLIRIVRGKQSWSGYCCFVNKEQGRLVDLGLTGKEEVERFKVSIEFSHKRWKELGLKPPVKESDLPSYELADMNMKMYHTIYLEPKK